jgi:hypothetical protein
MGYARIEEGFWTDPMIKSLSLEGKILAAWLFTNPHRHFSGLYYLPRVLIAVEIGVSIEVSNHELNVLEDKGFLRYSDEYSVVWVKKMLFHQSGGTLNEKQAKGISSHLKTLHGCPLITEFLERYKQFKIKYDGPINTPTDTPMDTKSKSQSQSKSQSKDISSSGDDPVPSFSVNDLAKIWNQSAPSYLPRVTKFPLSQNRSKKLNRHINGSDPEYWEMLFREIDLSPFYSGKNGKWPGMDFDWAVINHEKLRRKLDAEKIKRPTMEDDGPNYQLFVPPPPNPNDLTPDPDCTICQGGGIRKPQKAGEKHTPCKCLHPVGAPK